MSIDEALIDRLSTEAGRRLLQRSRAGRKRALEAISRFVVTVTRDGITTWEELFDQPPTLERLRTRCGDDAFVVAVRLRRKSLRDRIRLAIAAE